MGRSVSVSGISILLAVFLSASLCPVFAADEDKRYEVRTISAVESCSALNRALVTAKKHDDWRYLYGFSLYTMGYLTGINRVASDTYDIAGTKNTKTLMVWLEKYCAKHPEDSFNNALVRLTAELYPHRR
jgi:hypothetical protein